MVKHLLFNEWNIYEHIWKYDNILIQKVIVGFYNLKL